MFSFDMFLGDAKKETNDFSAILEQTPNVGQWMSVYPIKKTLTKYDYLSFCRWKCFFIPQNHCVICKARGKTDDKGRVDK